ncbi:MAG TPA: TonB family protein [Burkholderiales bacterium]|nr:TonB family protein [Burkholderiales bacterium]
MSAVMQRELRGYRESRAFNYALALSLLLHALLLFGLPGFRDSKRPSIAPGLITARLVPPQALPAAPDVAPAAPLARPALRPALQPQPAALLAPSIPASPADSAESTSAEPVPAAEPEAGTTAPSAEPAAEAGSVDQYRLQLISAAKRYKRYPRVAVDNNWEGGVVVRMVIGADGLIASASVKTGSGHEVLDSQALEMFKRAKPLVPIPPALRGKELSLDLRAIYNLMDQE